MRSFGVSELAIAPGQLQLSANNPEQEEAEETVSVDYQGRQPRGRV